MRKPKQGAPLEEPNVEKRYEVLQLNAIPEYGPPDRGFGIHDNRHKTVVAYGFDTADEASASRRFSDWVASSNPRPTSSCTEWS